MIVMRLPAAQPGSTKTGASVGGGPRGNPGPPALILLRDLPTPL
jgi:hypothetical protein